ncbi:MAG: triple tyrosine motif-containing protein, partial [Bacteroidota bacterium]
DFIMNVYQSKDGFIWTSGYSGYSRFDGKRFLNYSSKNVPVIKADNNVSLFTESQDSTMWFTTASSGLLSFKKGVFKAYLTGFPNLFFVGKTRKGELIISIGGMRAEKYIAFNTGTLKYFAFAIDELPHYLSTRLNNTDTLSGKWNMKAGKLYHLNNAGANELIGERQGVTRDMSLSIFMVDSKKRTWMTSEWGLYTWNGEKMMAYPGMENTAMIPTNPTFGLMTEDKDHGIWVSTGHGGLGYLPDGDSVFHLFPREYLNIQALNNLTVDREGNIWVATDRGLFKLSKTKLINYTSAEGIENNRVTAICQSDSNTFLVGNFYNQWYELKNSIVKPVAFRDDALLKESGVCYYCFVDSKKNKWLCCNRLIYKITGREQKAYRLDGEARYGFEGIDGRIYFGVPYKGIGYINDKGLIEYLPLKGIDFSQIYLSSIRQLKDGTWVVCSFRTGVYFIKPDGQVKNIDISDDFKGVQVFASYVDPGDDNALWFASGAGLVKFQGDQKKIIGANAGIPDLALFGILPDHTGRWWLPTNTGIISVKKSQLDSFINNPSYRVDWDIIDEGDGMSNRQCVGARHSIVSADGRVMVLGIGGLIELDPGFIRKNETPPLVSVNQMLVDDSSYHASSASIVPPGNHRYIFDYSALSFIAPEKNKIRFRLVGYDDKWINSVGDQRAFYTNLPPGDYHFEVMASNNDGLWSKEAASFSFYV